MRVAGLPAPATASCQGFVGVCRRGAPRRGCASPGPWGPKPRSRPGHRLQAVPSSGPVLCKFDTTLRCSPVHKERVNAVANPVGLCGGVAVPQPPALHQGRQPQQPGLCCGCPVGADRWCLQAPVSSVCAASACHGAGRDTGLGAGSGVPSPGQPTWLWGRRRPGRLSCLEPSWALLGSPENRDKKHSTGKWQEMDVPSATHPHLHPCGS